ncbi:hypothetical protein [Burkholderia gladioli]|uniref:hypothetical protein n=1 Tax=Burkholderia gladioli TaxID=28095 RepID=UPI001FC894D1|nr:hypothetical protein [Burkholderia gladioli]
MHDPYLLAGIVALLAVVQSIFGMGVLVFGTPTLLLLGFDFTSVLGLLLPSSMAISAIQVATGRGEPLPARPCRRASGSTCCSARWRSWWRWRCWWRPGSRPASRS